MANFIFSALLALCVTLMPVSAKADRGPALQDTIPVIALEDSSSSNKTFENLKGEKGAAIVFVRSVDWCPYCQAQLIELSARNEDFEKAGYKLVSISYDGVDKLASFKKKHSISFVMLSDPASDLIRSFDLLDDSFAVGSFAYGAPKPAIFIVDNEQKVSAKFYEEDYKKRPSVDDVLSAIKGPEKEKADELTQIDDTEMVKQDAAKVQNKMKKQKQKKIEDIEPSSE